MAFQGSILQGKDTFIVIVGKEVQILKEAYGKNVEVVNGITVNQGLVQTFPMVVVDFPIIWITDEDKEKVQIDVQVFNKNVRNPL